MTYAIAERRVLQRAKLDGGGATVVEWVANLRYGTHATRVQAKAAFWRAMDPSLARANDEFVARHFDQQQRNGGAYKVVRVLCPDKTSV